jgi:hypothetical protein
MSAIVLLLVIALVSLLITRVATIALTVTGLPHQAARFQARSALSGVGFTTSETEQVVNHPVRRRIIMALMLLGNVGIVTAVAGLLGGFLGAGGRTVYRALFLVAGLAAVYGCRARRGSTAPRRASSGACSAGTRTSTCATTPACSTSTATTRSMRC